jgi:hypothetical protein
MPGMALRRQRELYGRQCGAFARSTGLPCRAVTLGRGQRCKLHGGKSTGCRTEEGRQRIIESNRRRKGEVRAPRRPKPAPTAPPPTASEIWRARREAVQAALGAFGAEHARSPESITFWRDLIIAERRAIGWPVPTPGKPGLRREISIEAVQRRRLWMNGDYELIDGASAEGAA